ncbi:MAG TPA: LruC domain-containing protein, partial [Bacteroidales bacterium]|nr:LruC domain-containing protein [Bacteroidales bacterium]
GQFGAGKGIGFFLVSDGFRNGGVTNGIKTWYSNPAFNDESQPSKKKHNIVLVDQARDIFLMGFEDLIRSNGGSDEDFNDALFLVEANPIEAVDTDGFPPPDYVGTDDDNDGIPNNLDDYPTDPERAFNNYYPAKNTYGTLAFEDLWPGKGDYDFNDVVVDYNVNQVTNAQNKVVDVNPTYVLRARGASFQNGFGFQLNLLPSGVASVTGQRLTDNLVNLNANNTEAGQSKAVIMVFDNGSSILPYGGGNAIGTNTTPGAPWVTPDTIRMNIHLTTPILASAFGYPPYNPFIFTNGNRSKEVHLADKAPTDLADLSLFGTAQDDSNPATGKYYKTKNNLPWAIHLTERFVYPNEKTPTNTGYNYFNQWAESGGTLYTDWYKNISGYRNTENLYE